MLKFDYTFLLLAANFLFLIYVLNALLFRPFLALIEKRKASTTGFLESAKQMGAEREKMLEELKKEFSQAAQKAREEFDSRRVVGLDSQRAAMSKAGGEAASITEKARMELRSVAEKARTELRAEVEKFSDDIVMKLAGVK